MATRRQYIGACLGILAAVALLSILTQLYIEDNFLDGASWPKCAILTRQDIFFVTVGAIGLN